MTIWRKLRMVWRPTPTPSLTPAPEPEPTLNVFEAFFRLKPWQKIALVILCALVYALYIGAPFSSNVLPHFKAILNRDGSLNPGEVTSSLILSGTVVGIVIIPLLMKTSSGMFQKCGLVLTSMVIIYINVTNGCGTQGMARALRNDEPRQKIERVHRLDAEIDQLNRAFKEMPVHQIVTPGMLKAAEDAAETLKKSAADECRTGVFGSTRGPKCDGLEKRRDARLEEVAKLEANKALTDRAATIEHELYERQEARKAMGAIPEHVDIEMEVFTGFLRALHVITPDQGKTLTEYKPVMEVLCMELMAFFLATPTVMGLCTLFILLTCTKGEIASLRAQRAKPVELPELTPEEVDGSDPEITAFLIRNTTRCVGGTVTSERLFEAYRADCMARGIETGKQRAFTTRVRRFATLGVSKKTKRGVWLGIALKARDEAPKLRIVDRQ